MACDTPSSGLSKEKLEVLDTVPTMSITTITGKTFSMGKHSQEALQTWLEKEDLTIDIAADPERAIYEQFAGWAEYNPDMIHLALASF